MTNLRGPFRAVLLLLAAGAAAAQTKVPATPAATTTAHKTRHVRPPQAPYNPNVVVLDPAHGGSDTGAHLGRAGEEKDLNLAFAERLKTLLEAQQFTVILTHSSADENPTPDQRAESTNRSRAVACLLLHATNAGHGVHLFTSALTAPFYSGDATQETSITPWDSAQAPVLPKSLELANEMSTALDDLRVPLIVSRVSVLPIDSLTCPAVAVELAPAAPDTSVADATYQQQVAQSLVTALNYWREHAREQIAAMQAAAAAANPTEASPLAEKPKPRPRAKPIVAPDESPLAPVTAPRKPAPIERRKPAAVTAPPTGGRP